MQNAKSSQKVSGPQFTAAEFSRNVWAVVPDAPLTDLLNPDAWAHVAKKLKARDRIEVYPADGSYFAELIVIAASPLWAKVAVLTKVEFTAASATAAAPSEYDIRFRGAKKWSVVRLSDKQVLAEDLGDKEAARAWLDQYQQTMAA